MAYEHPPKPNLSFTSVRAFNECRRRWALKYAPKSFSFETRNEIFFENKLMAFHFLKGQLVDDVITEAIRDVLAGENWPTELRLKVRPVAREYFELSKLWAMRESPPDVLRQPIAELFYRPHTLSSADWDACFQLAEECLQNFDGSEMKALIESFPRESWVVQDKGSFAPWFMLDGIPIYAKFDFAIRDREKTILFDWKTGDPKFEKGAIRQLHWYAVFAHVSWGVPYDQIEVAPVWLRCAIPQPWVTQPVDPDLIAELTAEWKQLYHAVKEPLDAVHSGTLDVFEAFPTTEDLNECQRCTFRICSQNPRPLEGYVRV